MKKRSDETACMLVPEIAFPSSERSEPVRVAVLGSTGSVGTSALEVIDQNPGDFSLVGIAAGQNVEKLIEQAHRYQPAMAVLSAEPKTEPDLPSGVTFSSGADAVAELAAHPGVDVVLAAISGSAGLASTVAALRARKTVALANKESIVCAGPYIRSLLHESGAQIIPVDSEHSALFQAMQGNRRQDIDRLVLTASGGPFLHTSREQFAAITPEQALRHPRWEMGAKITIDSATLMNKALEFIEAHWLFAMESDKIEVVVHPQSIVHSVVGYVDGSQIAQLSSPDMKGPIAYAMKYPFGRSRNVIPALSLAEVGTLEFLALDEEKFEAIQLARDCLAEGGIAPIVLNVANEVAVELFLERKMSFLSIYSFLHRALDRYTGRLPHSVDSVIDLVDSLHAELRARAELEAC